MQDDPKNKHVSQGKSIYQNPREPPPKKMNRVEEKLFSNNFVHLIHKACQIASTFTTQCHCHHLHCHSTTYHHQSHPLHSIYSTPYNPSQSLPVSCTAMLLWSLLTKYNICVSWVITLLEPMQNIFSKDGVSELILNTFVLYFCVVSVVWSVRGLCCVCGLVSQRYVLCLWSGQSEVCVVSVVWSVRGLCCVCGLVSQSSWLF
jgi:hypothetical protein